jgi:hypothetical protein
LPVLTEALLFLIRILFLPPVLSIVPGEESRFEDVEAVVYNLTVEEGLVYIDSLASSGALEDHMAEGLRARIMNKPGLWDRWGETAGTVFESALSAYEDRGLSSTTDSLSLCSLLLDYAYYSARAAYADTSHSGMHRERELQALNEALRISVSEWQRERASMELARYYSRNAQPDSHVHTHFENVVARSRNSNALGPAYWHWNDWLISHGEMDSVLQRLNVMKHTLNGTKWDIRAQDLMNLVTRTELFIESVEITDSSVKIVTSLRNVTGEVDLSICRLSEDLWAQECGMGPLDGYRLPSREVRYTEVISAGMNGEILTWGIPVPIPGLYELELAYRDTSVSHSLGVFSFTPSTKRGTSYTSIQGIPCDADVFACVLRRNGEWLPIPDIVRSDSFVRVPVGGEEQIQVFITGRRCTGWFGSIGTGPTFQIIRDWHGE